MIEYICKVSMKNGDLGSLKYQTLKVFKFVEKKNTCSQVSNWVTIISYHMLALFRTESSYSFTMPEECNKICVLLLDPENSSGS